jgi:hypothetical protein
MRSTPALKRAALAVLLAAAWAGCINSGSSVNLQPVELAISSAASLGLVSTIAMSAIASGSSTNVSTPCAEVTQACTSFPCNGAVTVTLGPACPVPIGGVGSGTIAVTGSWTSSTDATLSESFTNVKVGAGDSVVVSATDLSVSSGTVSFTGQNVNVQGALVLAAQSSWTVASNGPDGGFTINGSNQDVAGISTSQITVSNVDLDPSCTENPIAGSAVIQSTSGPADLDITNSNVTFGPACNGQAEVDGSAVKLDFSSS